MSDVTKRLDSLSPEKRALLELLRKEKRQQNQQKQMISRMPDTNVYPLSQAQQRLWLMEQIEPGSSLYNIPSALQLKGILDVKALELALTVMLKRHEALRARFANLEGEPVQTIGPVVRFELPLTDLRNLPLQKREARSIEMAEEEIQRPFDLECGPLMRGSLIRLKEEEYVLLLTTHHIASDAWSRVVLTKEMIALYQEFSTGVSSSLPVQELQYVDYAHWQRELLQSDKMLKDVKYWKSTMAGVTPMLELPTDRTRPPVQTNRGARYSFIVPIEKVELLKDLGREEGTTLFMTLLAAFQVLLHGYSGQKDIIVGTAIANRTRQELENMIGFFVNTLVMRGDLSEEQTFLDLLQQIKEVALGAYEHQDLPFEKLVELIQPQRSLSYHPVFQVFFDMDNVPEDAIELQNLTIRPMEINHGTSKFDLSLYAREQHEGLYLTFEYSTDLFDSGTIERMGSHFQNLLCAITEAPEQLIGALPLHNQEEQEELFLTCKGQFQEVSDEICIHHLFEKQVSRTPDGVAVSFAERKLTYKELNEEANRLANALQKRGVKPGDLIAICVERSLEMVIGIFAIWKAGGVHIPLDPNYPKNRLAMMIEDTMPTLLLTQHHIMDNLPFFSGDVLVLDAHPKFYADEEVTPPEQVGKADQLAYITFTSGSTGRPKGVMATHHGPVNYLSFIKKVYQLEPSDIVLQLASTSFDASIRDLIGPLTAGAQVVIPCPQDILDFEYLLKLIEEKQITRVLSMVPTLLTNLTKTAVNLNWRNDRLKTILLSGEVLHTSVVAQATEVFRSATLVNQYGPTECTMTSSYYPLMALEPNAVAVPVGKPIFNTCFYLLNSSMRPVPIGLPGELYIGGKGVSNGYYKQHDLTNQKFVANPFADHNEMLYRTGDIMRLRSDGNFEFLGRQDSQVKLRGLRIELGEIESTLCRHVGVQNAVVILSEPHLGEQQLVAYYVSDSFESLSTSMLRQYLKEKLPEYMVPGTFVQLDRFPLTPNGKIDRKALSSLKGVGQKQVKEYLEPLTEMEEKLAQIWADVLKIDRVSMLDNFFELGGHSLLASQLIAKVRKEFQMDVPLKVLFESSDVTSMAKTIEELQASGGQGTLVTTALPMVITELENAEEPFPLTDIQQAYWVGRKGFYELGNVATHSYMELEMVDLDIDRLNEALNKLVARHGMLRAVLTIEGQQRVLKEVPLYQIKVLDLKSLDEKTAENQLEEVREELSHQVLELDKWPMFDIRVTRLSEQRSLLHISTDSFVSDAWSRLIMGSELFRMYQDPAAEWPQLQLSFRDYVLAEREIRNSQYYERAKNYWSERLSDLPLAPELPLAVAQESLIKPHFVRRSARLDPTVWQSLRTRAAQAGLTPSGLILAAYAAVLGRWSKTQRFTINLTLFNRLPIHEQVNEIVGDFTSSILLAVNQSSSSFEDQARKIQRQLFNDIDHSAFSGVQVLRDLNRMRGGSDMRAAMPVVLTSTLIDNSNEGSQDTFSSIWQENMMAGISQTPQVYLDNAVSEREGALLFRWDVVEEIFPVGMIQDMFDAFCDFLTKLV